MSCKLCVVGGFFFKRGGGHLGWPGWVEFQRVLFRYFARGPPNLCALLLLSPPPPPPAPSFCVHVCGGVPREAGHTVTLRGQKAEHSCVESRTL